MSDIPMITFIDYTEDDQVLYEGRGTLYDAIAFIGRLLRDDRVTEIHMTKGTVTSPRWLEVEE